MSLPPSNSRHALAFSIHSTIFLFLLSFRILNAVSIRTFFQPDEYFQSLEPAWHIAFREGWLTWEWHHKLRSIAHPMIFAGLYKSLSFLSDLLRFHPHRQTQLYVVAPRILQAVFAALGDWGTARLAGRLWGSEIGWVSLLLSMGSAWHWFCGTRTFANSLEAVVTVVALSMWPWKWAAGEKGGPMQPRGELRLSFLLAAFACVLRPTNLLVWGFLGAFAVWNGVGRRWRLILDAAWIGGAVFLGNALLDYAYYGEWVFPPITFLKFNLLHSLSGFYGRNDWHYYISQGLPLLLTAFLPLALYALFTSIRTSNPASPEFQLAATVVGVAGVYSLIAHKEVRFLYPLLPILHVLSAKNLQNLRWSSKTKRSVLVGMVFLNIPIAYYAAFVHQRGVVDVIDHLRETRGEWSSVGFLMPCHSTPWRSSLGYPGAPGEIWALTCEPPVDLPTAERQGYLDEADQFYADPRKFVNAHIGERGEGRRYAWPDRLVMFEQLVSGDDSPSSLSGVIGMRYEECWRGFNSHVHDDWRRKGDVLVYCSKKSWDIEASPVEEENAI